jgi:hypothetical protein
VLTVTRKFIKHIRGTIAQVFSFTGSSEIEKLFAALIPENAYTDLWAVDQSWNRISQRTCGLRLRVTLRGFLIAEIVYYNQADGGGCGGSTNSIATVEGLQQFLRSDDGLGLATLLADNIRLQQPFTRQHLDLWQRRAKAYDATLKLLRKAQTLATRENLVESLGLRQVLDKTLTERTRARSQEIHYKQVLAAQTRLLQMIRP